jgi:hypothetical protein
MAIEPFDFNSTDDVFLITLNSVDDPELEYFTFVKGTNELAFFLLHYDKNRFLFSNAEGFAEGGKVFWNFRDVLTKKERLLEKGDNDDKQ